MITKDIVLVARGPAADAAQTLSHGLEYQLLHFLSLRHELARRENGDGALATQT